MSSRARRREQFLKANPACCFCGGTCPATTEDHVPARSFFSGRAWPEGYVFPACEACNESTKLAEQVINFLSRCIGEDFIFPTDEAEFNAAITALVNNHPDVIEQLLPGGEFRNALGRPALDVTGPIVRDAMRDFARKLFSALHYRATNRIIPRSGGIAWRWWSNVDVHTGRIEQDFLRNFRNVQNLKRTNYSLNYQFSYTRTVSAIGDKGIYLASFRRAFVITGVVALDREFLTRDAPPEATILEPLQHNPD